MDINETFDALVSEMNWTEIVSTIEDVLAETQKIEAEDPTGQPLNVPLSFVPSVHIGQAVPWDEEALHKNVFCSQDVHNQEFGCHPAQVAKKLHKMFIKY